MFESPQELTLNTNGFRIGEQSTPTNNLPDSIWLYCRDKGGASGLFYKDESDVEHDLSGSFVTGSGTLNRLAYWNSATSLAANAALTTGRIPFADANGLPTDSANLFFDGTNFRVGIKTITPQEELNVVTTGSVTRGIINIQVGADANGAVLGVRKTRNASATGNTTLQSGDTIGDLQFEGNTGAGFLRGALIRSSTTEIWSGVTAGSNLRFFTVPSGSVSLNERVTIIDSGKVGIGTPTPNEQLELTGNLRLVASTSTAGIIYSGANTLLHTFGTNSVFLGIGAGNLTQSIGYNIGIGPLTLVGATSGNTNVAIGFQALKHLTTGFDNTAIGTNNLLALTTGSRNVAIGGESVLSSVTTGTDLIGIGNASMSALTTGTFDIGIGTNSSGGLIDGSYNLSIGDSALLSNIHGSFNVAIGKGTLRLVATALNSGENIGIGYTAGDVITTGTANVCIGSSANVSIGTLVNSIVIGSSAIVSDSHHCVLGDDAGCVGIGNSARRPTGTRGLIFSAGTALSSMVAGTAGLYAQTVSGVTHLIAIASDGTIIQLV